MQPAFILCLVGHHTNSFRVARHRFGVTGLFVVAGPGVDLKGPVNLLQDHHPRQVVGKVMGDMESRNCAFSFTEGCRPKDP